MPLTKLQTDILAIIAAQRDPESYVAGATPINQAGPRYSTDIDIFHDREERVAEFARADAAALAAAGFTVQWLRQQPAIYAAQVGRGGEWTRLEWAADSDFRFFPTVRHPVFGYTLHPVDLAINKVMAAAGRKEVRDAIDLVSIDAHVAPLGALVWAAVEKAPGYTPEGLIAEIRRSTVHHREAYSTANASVPIVPDDIVRELRRILDAADTFVRRMPTEKAGLLFLDCGRVVQPDPDRLEEYVTHAGVRRGHWPSSPEIAAAMLEALVADTGASHS